MCPIEVFESGPSSSSHAVPGDNISVDSLDQVKCVTFLWVLKLASTRPCWTPGTAWGTKQTDGRVGRQAVGTVKWVCNYTS